MNRPMLAQTYFNGRALEDYGIVVERVSEGIPEMREDLEDKVGGHGSYLRSLTVDTREITLGCRAFCDTWQDFEDLKATLAGLLVTSADKKLVLRTHPDQYYMAHYVSYSEGERVGGTGIAEFELTFNATDPLRYGARRSQVVKSGTKSISVGGTHAADLKISTTNAKRSSSDHLWGLKVNGSALRVELPSAAEAKVEIDCVARTVKVNGTASMLTLASNWPTIPPGTRKVELDKGTGTVTLSWVQRHA